VDQIKTSLRSADEKVVCVSTQLVEAGVDFSFQYVIRLIAGLDNIIQSAGRCNRHGECAGTAYVDIMNIQDEDTSRLKEIQMRQNVMRAFLDEYARDKHSYHDDLASDISIYRYYKRMYKELENKKTIWYPINLQGIQCYLYKLLGRMGGEQQILCQPFKTVGDAFEVFDDHGMDILVPYGDEGKRLIADFFSERAKHDILYVKGLLETSKNYTIHVFEYEYRKLCDMEMVQKISYGTSEIVCLKEAYYDEEGIGLDMEGQFEFMNM
jgi:CRISPR-associated endonuclease/helicase Cas3